MKKIPFEFMPASWGLKGKSRAVAQAEYYLTGYDLKFRLLELDKDEMTKKQYFTKLYDLDFEYGKMDKKTHLRQLASLIEDEEQKELAILELDRNEGKLTDHQYDKAVATRKKQPWVSVLDMSFSGEKSLEGSFELDWNEFFVEDLKSKGYVGPTPDSIVNQWFMEVCRNVAMEEFDGTGDFAADSAANLETLRRWNSRSEPVGKDHKGYR